MRKTIKVAFICFIMIALSSFVLCEHSRAEEYRPKYSHYSFLIPAGWMRIPNSAIMKQDSERMDKAWKEDNALINPMHREVFQRESPQMFCKPYFTVYDLREGSWFIEQGVSRGMKTTAETVRLGENTEDIYDKSRCIILYKVKDDECKVMLLGKESSVEVIFSPSSDTFEDDMKIFNDVINSFRYDKEFTFNQP